MDSWPGLVWWST